MKYIQAQRGIMSMISRERMENGSKIPDEETLTKALGVSIITTRRALKELSNLGLIERVQGRGTFVRKELARETSSGILGLLLISGTELKNDHISAYGTLIAQFQEECGKHGYDLKVFLMEKTFPGIEIRELAGLCGAFVSGIVDDDCVACLKSMNLPFVVVGESIATIPVTVVSYDWKTATKMLVSRLISRGCKRIAFLNGSQNYPPSVKCYEGYREAVSECNLPFYDSWVAWCPRTEYKNKFTEFFTRHADTEFDAIIAEEGLFPQFMSFLYDNALLYNRRVPIGIISVNQQVIKSSCFINVDFPELITKYSMEELLHDLTTSGNKTRSILLKPQFIE